MRKESIETSYCFFHQKWRVYAHSTDERQKEEIEYIIGNYILEMDPTLYHTLANGSPHFLCTHSTFANDMVSALNQLETLMATF